MSYLSLQKINKIYPGNVQAVYDFDLEVKQGEFIVLVGPSGCGKSSVLRMIAGLEGISEGNMFLDGKKINDLAPSDRNVAMVFQDYALYGNMTIYQNIGFSLTIRGENTDRIHEKVMSVSRMIGLFDYLNRYPKTLSGGQKQRVAMGRSIAKEAKVLLMDEPLSNLDAKLRQQTRKELAVLHQELHSTILYVTHDQTEAMTMASRIVVMNEGKIQQIGTPYEVYHYPENIFTASFVGMPGINLINGLIEGDFFIGMNTGQKACIKVEIPRGFTDSAGICHADGIVMGIRPENIITGQAVNPGEKYFFDAEVRTLELLGAEYHAGLDIRGLNFTCRIPARQEIKPGQKMPVVLNADKMHFFDRKTGVRIKNEKRQ
jgi:multiple sugar transport system ATP-binding protein